MTTYFGTPILTFSSLTVVLAFMCFSAWKRGQVLSVINNKAAIIMIVVEWIVIIFLININGLFNETKLHGCNITAFEVRK